MRILSNFSNVLCLVKDAKLATRFFDLALGHGYNLSIVTNSHYEPNNDYIELALLKDGAFFKECQEESIIPYMSFEVFSELVRELKGLEEDESPEEIFKKYYKEEEEEEEEEGESKKDHTLLQGSYSIIVFTLEDFNSIDHNDNLLQKVVIYYLK